MRQAGEYTREEGPTHPDPWSAGTMVNVFSATKGLAAMTLAVARLRGWLDYDARVAQYWPGFASNGKQGIAVRQLLAHQPGLAAHQLGYFAYDDPRDLALRRALDRCRSRVIGGRL